jgi:hypothetical protein
METFFKQLADDLWVAPRPLRFFGLQLGTHMTVIRLKDGSLFLHSPVALDAPTLGRLQSLGEVRFIVAPNRLHHLFLADYFKVFPQARIYAAPGLEKKRRDLPFHGVLGEKPEAGWAEEIDQVWIPDLPILNEVAFLHRASRTLILTDMALNIFGPDYPFLTRLVLKLFQVHGRFGPTRDQKFFIKRRPRAQAALKKILSWDFDRIIVAHGAWIESGGKQTFQAAFEAELKNIPNIT